jgi:hypothetical protein
MKRVVITTIVAGLPLFAQDGNKLPAPVTSTESVNFAPGGTIRLTAPASNLFVEAWDRPEVEVTTIKSGQRAKCLDDIHVVTTRASATELAVTITLPPSSFFTRLFGRTCRAKVEQHIQAPRDSHLVIQHGAGYVLVSRISGEIDASSRSGDIVLMLPDPGPYSIDAKSKFGSVSSDFAGTGHREKLIGEQFATPSLSQARKIHLRIGFGGIAIKEVPATPVAPVPAGGQ